MYYRTWPLANAGGEVGRLNEFPSQNSRKPNARQRSDRSHGSPSASLSSFGDYSRVARGAATPPPGGQSPHEVAQPYQAPPDYNDSQLPADLPSSALDATGISPSRRATPAEKARESRLKSDPIVIVHGPQLVQCRRCATFIKLSLKSHYDPAHWHKHRERCLKRPDSLVSELRKENEQRTPAVSSETTVGRSSRRRTATSLTPPLTPDGDGDRSSVSLLIDELPSTQRAQSPLPRTEEAATSPEDATPVPNALFEEYLLRSQRRSAHRDDISPQFPASWQDWKWSQLRAPIWVAEGRPGLAEVDDDDDDMISMFALSAIRDEPREPAPAVPTASAGHPRLE